MAKDRVAKISVGFETRLAALEKGFKEARAKSKAAGKDIESAFDKAFANAGKSLLKWAAGFVAVKTAIRGVTSLLNSAFAGLNELDANSKLAGRLGTTPDKLAGLQFGAALSGDGAEPLNAGLETLAKNLGLAANGTGRAVQTLKDLGLSAKEITKLDAVDQFDMIADAISKLKTPAEKMAATSRLFGDTGLVNLLNEGSEGLAKLRAEAEKLGVVGTAKFGAAAERANDAMTRFQFRMKAMQQEFAIALAPVIESLFTRLAGGLQPGGGMEDRIRGLSQGIAGIVEIFAKLGQAVFKVIELIATLGEFIAKAIAFLVPNFVSTLPDDISKIATVVRKITEAPGKVNFDGISKDVAKSLDFMFSEAGKVGKNRIASARFAGDDGGSLMGDLGGAFDVNSVEGISQFLRNQRGANAVVTELKGVNAKLADSQERLRLIESAVTAGVNGVLNAGRNP